jgi:YebC/PmpR family DNA-binding regulatory protein
MEVMTDNKNRIVAEIRHMLTKHGGNLGAAGCVAWMFEKQGVITVDPTQADEAVVTETAIEAGAEDITTDTGSIEILTQPGDLETVKEALEAKKIPIVSTEITMNAKNSVKITNESEASSMMKLYEALEEHDDVQKVYSNFDIDEKLMEKLA